MGEHNGYRYRLRPFAFALDAGFEKDEAARRLLPHMFLGLNKITKQPVADTARARYQQDPTFTHSRSNDASGFTFFQLGILEYIPPEIWDWRHSGASLEKMPSYPTDYIVAIQIDEKGRGGDIWIIYNDKPTASHFPARKHTAYRNPTSSPTDTLVSDDPPAKHRPAARIASSLSRLAATLDTKLNLPHPSTPHVIPNFALVPAILETRRDGETLILRDHAPVVPLRQSNFAPLPAWQDGPASQREDLVADEAAASVGTAQRTPRVRRGENAAQPASPPETAIPRIKLEEPMDGAGEATWAEKAECPVTITVTEVL
ncbi:hypothetical protein ACN47E_003268 [Coniothyrium glycines]